MNLTERLRFRKPSPGPAAPDLTSSPPATVHVEADGGVVIDLRDPVVFERPAASTDMVCQNCGGGMRVDGVDTTARLAELHCADCGFTFHHRLSRPSPSR